MLLSMFTPLLVFGLTSPGTQTQTGLQDQQDMVLGFPTILFILSILSKTILFLCFLLDQSGPGKRLG
jgi:hypothetical protein